LIVILVVLTVIILVVVIAGVFVYRNRHSSKFNISAGSVKYGGTDYIDNNTAVNNLYVTTQELQTSRNVQEMVSSDPEPYKEGREDDDSGVKQNLSVDDDDDTDTHL